MDRRKALRQMGLSLGYIAATPLVMDLLQSCTKEAGLKWTPEFFSKDESIVIQNLIDLILPNSSSSPGALEVNIPQFLDAYYKEVVSKKEQDVFKKGTQLITKTLGTVSGLSKNDYDALLAKYLKASKDDIASFKNDKDNELIYSTLIKLRSNAVWAFKNSQKIGMEVMAYDPIPGEHYGCVSLEETTGGKSWSL